MPSPTPTTDELIDLSHRLWEASFGSMPVRNDPVLIRDVQTKIFEHLEVKALGDNSLQLKTPVMVDDSQRSAFADVLNRGLAYVGIRLLPDSIERAHSNPIQDVLNRAERTDLTSFFIKKPDVCDHHIFTVPQIDIARVLKDVPENEKTLKQGSAEAAVLTLVDRAKTKDNTVDLELPIPRPAAKPPAQK